MSFKIDLNKVREELKINDHTTLGEIYTHCEDYCQSYLKKKYKLQDSEIHDIYVDALLVFRRNILKNKLTELSNIKSYILGICINLNREETVKKVKAQKKVDEISLLLNEKNHNTTEKVDETILMKIKKSLETVGEKCQDILKMYYIWEYSMKDIAEEMELASGDVAKTLKSRCYKKWITSFHSI